MTATADLDVLPLEWMDRGDQPALDLTPPPACRHTQPCEAVKVGEPCNLPEGARRPSALRWTPAGTSLVPCTIIKRLPRSRYLIRFDDGVETNAPAEYVVR